MENILNIIQPLAEAYEEDGVKEVFHALMDLIDKTLTEAQDTLNNALDTVKAKAAELEAQANAELDNLLAPLREQLDALIAEAEARGFDVAQYQSYIDELSNIPVTMIKNLTDCMTQQITKAQDLVNDAIDNIKEIEQNLNTIDAEIDKCAEESSWKQAICFVALVMKIKIAKETAEAPEKIMAAVTNTVALVTEVIPDLVTSSHNEIKKAGEDAAKVVAEFALWVAD